MRWTSFILLFGLAFCLKAQVATISDPIDLRQDEDFEIMGRVGEYTMVIKDLSEGSTIYAFDAYMKKKWEQKVVLDKARHSVLGSLAHSDYFTVFFQYKIKGRSLVKAHKYDVSGALVDSTVVVNYGKRPFAPEAEMTYSHDKTKALFFAVTGERKIEAASFDAERMTTLWKDEIGTGEMNTSKHLFQILQNNKGDMLCIFNKDNIRSGRDKNRFVVLHRTSQGRYTINIPLKGKLFYDALFEFDNKNNQLVGVGLYDDRRMSRIKGAFYLNLDMANQEKQILNYQPFSTNFISAITGKEADENSTFGNSYINDIVLKSNGGLVLAFERFKHINSTLEPGFNRPSVGGFSDRSRTEFNYDDIILVSLSPSGEIDWHEILYKRQYSRDDDAAQSSFFLMKTPKSLRCIFNDDIKQENTVSEYILNRGGTKERKSLLDTEGYNVLLQFKYGTQVAANEILIPSIKRKSLKIVRIKY